MQIWLQHDKRLENRAKEGRKNDNRGVKFKKKEQIWLKTCKGLENKTKRKGDSCQKVKFKQISQMWLRAYEKSK